ncbi:MAG: hypothetical protein ACRDT6_02450 [Micromonosporaceae bacterium]
MRVLLRLTAVLALVILGWAPPAAASTATLTFGLASPNTATAPYGHHMAAAGDWIRATGGGSFDAATGDVSASGSFVHYRADGTVHCKGVWRATALTGWTDFGSDRYGRHGGVIELTTTHYCKTMRMTHRGVPMTVTSTVNAPPDTYQEGTTVGPFTVPTSGDVVISGR